MNMFTGIIESVGKVLNIRDEGANRHFTVTSALSEELKVDQSVCHDGVCLTVVELGTGWHRVTAVSETLGRSTLGNWKTGSKVNLERSMRSDGRLDGHIVQGHVDATVICEAVEENNGSWHLHFYCENTPEHLLVDKGSVCLNGVSLTVIKPENKRFSVAIIPYTWENTNLSDLHPGQKVNIEFDILGKYIARHLAAYANAGQFT